MTPRTGRPKIENPKRNETRIRMTDDDLQKLEFCQKATGKTKAEIIRLGIDLIYQQYNKA